MSYQGAGNSCYTRGRKTEENIHIIMYNLTRKAVCIGICPCGLGEGLT
ncbi:MAG: hypothetical protein Q8879_02830 [Candidatus Phytoplasma australasiaticum]|nr:hypothetical protein [Candidatus Phytoplasma australasiaticum]